MWWITNETGFSGHISLKEKAPYTTVNCHALLPISFGTVGNMCSLSSSSENARYCVSRLGRNHSLCNALRDPPQCFHTGRPSLV